MNTPSRPVFNSGPTITPRSQGYSYVNGSYLATVNPPVPINTFGTARSPSPSNAPITPQRVGALTVAPSQSKTSILRGLFS